MARTKKNGLEENKKQTASLSDVAVQPESLDENLMYMMNFRMTKSDLTVSALKNRYKRGTLDFDVDIQRGEMWTKSWSSLYIHSLLLDITPFQQAIIINVRTNPDNSTTEEVLDGKQRGLLTIIRYVNNEYALCGLKNEPYINCNGTPCQINGLRFSQLPPELQDKLMTTSIPVAKMYDATPQQKALIFKRVNNAKPMGKFDLARANKADMTDIINLASHELFTVMYGKSIAKLNHHKTVVESWIVENELEPIVSSSHINSLMENLNISENEQDKLTKDYDMILGAYKYIADNSPEIAKIILNSTHFLSYLSFVEKFETPKDCAAWMMDFYANLPKEYTQTTDKRPNQTANLKTRMNIVENSINRFLGNPADEDEENQPSQLSFE